MATNVLHTVPMRRTRVYCPELDILRFVAFLLVFFFHIAPAATGHHSLIGRILLSMRDCGAFGVCIFFVLSSYLITELLIREKETTGSVHFKAFYLRRILRIWPLYFLMLGIAALGAYFHSAYSATPGRFAAFFLMAGNWYVCFYGFAHVPFDPLWSVSIEEQYYLLWPPIIKRCGITALTYVSVAVGLLSYGVLTYFSLRRMDLSTSIWANSFVQFQFFAAGSILAVLQRKQLPKLGQAQRLLYVGLSFVLLFSADFLFHLKTPDAIATPATPIGYLLVLAATVLLLRGFLGSTPPSWMRPMIYLGKISYGLYVFHWIVIDLVSLLLSRQYTAHVAVLIGAPVSLAITILVAAASYKFYESPFLRLKERFTFVHSRDV